MERNKNVGFVVVLSLIIPTGLCLKCYFCLTIEETSQSINLVIMPCHESEVWVKRTRNATEIVPEITIKDCGPHDFCLKEDFDKFPGQCSTCGHDLCNSSTIFVSSLINTALLLIKSFL